MSVSHSANNITANLLNWIRRFAVILLAVTWRHRSRLEACDWSQLGGSDQLTKVEGKAVSLFLKFYENIGQENG